MTTKKFIHTVMDYLLDNSNEMANAGLQYNFEYAEYVNELEIRVWYKAVKDNTVLDIMNGGYHYISENLNDEITDLDTKWFDFVKSEIEKVTKK